MESTETLILLGFTPDASPDAVSRLEADLQLARILLRRGLVGAASLAEGVQLRNKSGLLLEHCLVRQCAVDFDAMLEVLAERRALATAADPLARLSVTWGTAPLPPI